MGDAIKFAKHYAKGARYLGYEALFSARKSLGAAKIEPPKLNKDKPDKIKKVLLCLNRHEYGKKEWGDSYEYTNIYPAISENYEAEFFDFRGYKREHGNAKMHEELESISNRGEFDAILFSLMVDDFDKERILKISEESPTITINWFSDDQWRFSSFSNYWAGAFNFVTTTDKTAPAKYAELGYPNAIHTQWGVYPPNWKPSSNYEEEPPEVVLVGQKYGKREEIVKYLQRRGLGAQGFGGGWKSGRVSHKKMVDIFAHAKINISPAEASILFAPMQMKARFFEVAACGGFQLAGRVEELDVYFKFGEEIDVYSDFEGLVKKAEYYLENEDLRGKVAQRAQKRCLKEHTYQQRYRQIFSEIEKRVKAAK